MCLRFSSSLADGHLLIVSLNNLLYVCTQKKDEEHSRISHCYKDIVLWDLGPSFVINLILKTHVKTPPPNTVTLGPSIMGFKGTQSSLSLLDESRRKQMDAIYKKKVNVMPMS